MAIAVTCICGKQLRVGDDHAGRKIRCPGCDKSLRVPDDTDVQQSDQPAPKRRRDDRDHDDNRGPKRGKKKQKRSAVPMILGGVALLLLLGGGGFAGYWFFLRGENMSESAFLAPDAQAIVTVRVADVAKFDAFQKLMKAQGGGDQLNEGFSKLGLASADVERFTFVGLDLEQNVNWAILTTTKPYDRKAVLAKFQDAKPYKHEGKTYHIGRVAGGGFSGPQAMPGGMGPGGAGGVMAPGGKSGGPATQQVVFFAGPKLLVLANEESSIKRGISAAVGKSATGPLADAVKEVGGPKHIYAVFNLPASTQEKMKAGIGMMGPQAKVAAPLLQFTGGTVSMDFGTNLVVDLSLKYADESRAKAAMNSFTALKGLAEVFLLPMVTDAKASEALKAVLAGLNGEQRGAELAVKLQVASMLLEAAVPQMPGGAGGFPRR